MTARLIVGPLLGFEGNDIYTVCFLTGKEVSSTALVLGGDSIAGRLVDTLPDGKFWRVEARIEASVGERGRQEQYQIQVDGNVVTDLHGRDSWQFYVPSGSERPKFAYASCNGVSKADIITKLEDPFALWRQMAELHRDDPFSLLIMGGDQVYADSIWEKVTTLESWSLLKLEKQILRMPTKKMSIQLDKFYSNLYRQRWSDENMSYMLASVPSVMMWDDHDIFDGWGSFPKELQQCPVFSEIFRYAKKYFEIFQIRCRSNRSLLIDDGSHFAFCVRFRDYTILGLDNRSGRSIQEVMSRAQWQQVIQQLAEINDGTLFVMSAVPVIYRDFSFTETAFDVTPWDESLTDDLKDHWRAKEHQGERNRLIMRLLDNARLRQQGKKSSRTVILSGDVHVGCVGVLNDSRCHLSPLKIHQVVSSGIVHPAPSLMQWLGIAAVTNDDAEIINEEGTIEARMLKPVGAKRYIRMRNFATLEEGTDKKLWVNWITEDIVGSETAEYPLYPIS
ncbi:alkaline phosphatase D family protein [Halomonas sp. AOP13-D3-9]